MTARKQQRLYLQAPSENGTVLIGLEDLVNANNNNTHSEVCILATDANGEVLQGQEVYVLTDQVDSTFDVDHDAVTIVGRKASNDNEELTSLAWLQDTNLLQNIHLSTAVPTAAEAAQSMKATDKRKPSKQVEAPPEESDETESSSWDDGSNLSTHSEPAQNQPQSMQVPSFDLGEAAAGHQTADKAATKPPHSFSALIFLAIESSPAKALPVRDIYAWITKHFPYYRQAPVGWKNSVRHNLSLNKCFYKVECGLNMSKGSYWMVDPQHRHQLVQSLCKVSYIKADLIHQLIKDAGLPATPNGPSLVAAHHHTSSTPIAAATKPRDPDNHKASMMMMALSPSPPSTCSSSTSTSSVRSNLPDPTLFPYLSRRLAFGSYTPSGPELDGPDVDAATAMLALGQSLQPRTNGVPVHHHQSSYGDRGETPESRSPSSSHTTSPADDHTYSFNSPRPVISPANGNKKPPANVSSSKRPFQHQEIAQQVPDVVKELEVHTYVLPSHDSSTPSRPAKAIKTRGGSVTRGRGGRPRGKPRRAR